MSAPDTTARDFLAAQREALAWAVNELQDQATWLRKERKTLEAMEADQRATILAALSESLSAHPTAEGAEKEIGRAARSEAAPLPDVRAYLGDVLSNSANNLAYAARYADQSAAAWEESDEFRDPSHEEHEHAVACHAKQRREARAIRAIFSAFGGHKRFVEVASLYAPRDEAAS